ncbi:inositol monophosphatase [Roseomonas xinghualingensis]|uniref:inositol monophosphatase n=1 Tax=Roseomonas xinghualingensis TaxID=2986475 RepID=UPI0021F0E7D5|nr:inositol monophosphatase [Roseomonas sp. SXEYE001]MCV4209156.1 inositol monophosphatase [Roseomonas sp. SXEYE001]
MSHFDEAALRAVDGILRAAAQAEIMPRFRRLAAVDIRTKSGPLDMVTDADECAERVISAALSELFPGCVVVGEEGCSADPALLDQLGVADLAFVVDPVDGTANFVAGMPLFGSMVAAFEKGEVVAAWIHDPLGEDTLTSMRGQGAWLAARDGTRSPPLRVAEAAPVSAMVGCISYGYLAEPMKSRVAARLPRLAKTWQLGCAAHEYRLLATGHTHLSLYNRLMPWDHAAGWLIHREAGGYSAHFDGSPYAPAADRAGGLICAPDRTCWEAARAAFLGE